MRVLVTGGCGYVGSASARLLATKGAQVHVLDDLSEGHRAAFDGPTEVIDLLDRGALRHFLSGRNFDGILHFAARCYVGESVRQPLRYWRSNLVPLIHLCEALPGIPLVLSSTCSTFGVPQRERISETHPQVPINPYGATKLAAERLLHDREIAGQGGFAALRYFNAAGASPDGAHGEHHDPETHLIPLCIRAAMAQREPLTIYGTDWDTPDGTCIRDYVHVDDLADAHLAALQRLMRGGASGQWNLGTGEGASVHQVIEAVEKHTERVVPTMHGPPRAGDPSRLVADPTLATTELGWAPRYTSIDAVVETAVRWHRLHPHGYAQ